MPWDKQAGARVIPFSLGMLGRLKLLPDGKRALTSTDFSKDNEWCRAVLGKLLDWLAAGSITPVVAERIALTEAPPRAPADGGRPLRGQARSGGLALVAIVR
jgi:NADPH:quinone reductase-like Zn-dependent oxidoreductase